MRGVTAERDEADDSRLLVAALLAALVVRLVFLRLLPEGAESLDFKYWLWLRGVFEAGANPYGATPYPPLWTQTLSLLHRASVVTGVPLRHFIHAVLIAADLGTIAAAHGLLKRIGPPELRARAGTLLLGLALNPVSVLLVCQHGNVDVLVGLWVVLAALFLVSWRQGGEVTDWLLAALCVGLGVLTKVVPIVLAPLLLAGVEKLSVRARVLGAVLLVGPTALAMSVLHAVDPGHLTRVITYRSLAGFHGFTGLMVATGQDRFIASFAAVSPFLILGALTAAAALVLRRKDLPPRTLVLLAGLLLLFLPTFGPGYGPQYASWFVAPLVVAHDRFGRGFRALLLVTYAVLVATYLVEYALLPSHGAFLLHASSARSLVEASKRLDSATSQFLLRAPLFVLSIAVVVAGARAAWRVADDGRADP